MSKEWKTLWFDGSLNNPTLRKLNKLTIEGWEVEYVIPDNIFLSREREKGEIEEEKLEEVRKEALKRIERQKKKDLMF
jgi:hypothetical protein